jgi:hypothetical protein
MTAPQAEPTVITSDFSDIGCVRLDVDVALSASDRARIMRGIGAVEGESGSPVSPFNSSI